MADLLLTSKEPLTSFESIKNADARELVVDNAGNLETWRTVRARRPHRWRQGAGRRRLLAARAPTCDLAPLPLIPAQARRAVAALSLSPEVVRIVETIAAEGRLDLLKHIARKAAEMRAVTSKALDAVVTSAVPLTKEQQASVAKALPAYAPAGSNLSVSYAVDPAILGGLLVTIKNQTIDLTAASRLVEVVAGARAMA